MCENRAEESRKQSKRSSNQHCFHVTVSPIAKPCDSNIILVSSANDIKFSLCIYLFQCSFLFRESVFLSLCLSLTFWRIRTWRRVDFWEVSDRYSVYVAYLSCAIISFFFVCVHTHTHMYSPCLQVLYMHLYIASLSVRPRYVCFCMPYVFISQSASVFVCKAICSLSGLVLTPRASSLSSCCRIKKTDMYQIFSSDVLSPIPTVY